LKIKIDDPETNTRRVKKAAALFGASLAGVCNLDRRWIYSPAYLLTPEGGKTDANIIPEEFKYAIAIAVEMDYDAIRCSPTGPASIATGLGYSKMAFSAGLLAQYIRGLGYQAIPCGNDTACSIPIAIDAGLGEMARNGLLITPEYGPRVRLAKVLTDLPLVLDRLQSSRLGARAGGAGQSRTGSDHRCRLCGFENRPFGSDPANTRCGRLRT